MVEQCRVSYRVPCPCLCEHAQLLRQHAHTSVGMAPSASYKRLPGVLATVAVLLFLSLSAGVSRADDTSTDQRYLAGLRSRGLYELAEAYCTQQLARADLAPSEQADLTIELARSLAEQAASSPPAERQPLWARAQDVVAEFVRRSSTNPRLPLVRMQGALVSLARGELARQEVEVVAHGELLLDDARTNLRLAVRSLESLDEDVERQWREANLPGGQRPDRMPRYQLAALKKNIEYQLARARRNQALCYPSDSADRANSLNEAIKQLEPLARVEAADPLAWRARLDLIKCYRLLKNYTTADRMIAAVVQLKPPPRVILKTQAEQIQLALVTDHLDAALTMLDKPRQINGITSPELDYAWLQTILAAWRRALDANRDSEAQRWQAKAGEMVHVIEAAHSPYWTRRAEMLLAGYVRVSPESGNLEMLVRAAESSYRSGRLDDALTGYDRARQAALDAGARDRAFDLGYAAAAIEHKRNHHQEALERYGRLALDMPGNSRAADAHMLAIHHAGQLVKQQPQQYLDGYLALLDEHLAKWPQAADAGKVRMQLGRLREHRADWAGAVEAYRGVAPDDPQFALAVQAAARCYEAWLKQCQADSKPTEQIADNAAEWFESLARTSSEQSAGDSLDAAQQAAIVAAARLWVNYAPSGQHRAEEMLAQTLRDNPDAPEAWRTTAEALLVSALAAQGKRREAAEVLEHISGGSAAQLLDLLAGLVRVAQTATPAVRAELAALELQTVELLRRNTNQLQADQQRRLARLEAQALADAGHTREALLAYRRLAEAYPRDGELQEAYAELLVEQTDRVSLQTALGKWRELEKHSPERSARWFRAKYNVALIQFRLGEKAKAAKIITLLKLLQPDLGGPEMRAKFESLLRRCQGA